MQKKETIYKDEVSNLYRNYVLVMLTLVYVFNFVDRQLLVILQESIKKELHLSDTQLGLLSGFTFAIFYKGFRANGPDTRKGIIAACELVAF